MRELLLRIASPVGLVFCASFALLALAVPLGLGFGDGGRVAAASFALAAGDAPLAVLVGKLAALVPVGEAVTRVHLLAALLGGLGAAGLLAAGRTLGGADPGSVPGPADRAPADTVLSVAAGLIAAALLLACPGGFSEAANPGLTLGRIAALAVALALGARLGDPAPVARARSGRLLALLAGLSIGLHPSLRLAIAAPALGASALRLRRGDRWPLVAPFAFALGAAVGFAPLGARGGEPDLAAARGLSGLLALGGGWLAPGSGLPPSLVVLGERLFGFAARLEEEAGLPALLAAALGLWNALARRRAASGWLLWLVLFDALRAALTPAIGPRALDVTPSVVALSLAAGVGVARACERILGGIAAPPRPLRALVVAGALAFLVLAPFALGGPLRRAASAAAWARAALDGLPSHALALPGDGDLGAALLYERVTAGARPDASFLAHQRLDDAVYVRALAAREPTLLSPEDAAAWAAQPERSRRRERTELWRRLLARGLPLGAVYFEPGDEPPPMGWPVEGGPLWELGRAPTPPPATVPLVQRLEGWLGAATPRPPAAARALATALLRIGEGFALRGDDAHAGPLFDLAREASPDEPRAEVRLAEARARAGDVTAALRLVEHALAHAPELVTARITAGDLRRQLGDLDGAERELERARRQSPESPAPRCGLARVAHARGDDSSARRIVEEALTLSPADPDARRLAEQLGPPP